MGARSDSLCARSLPGFFQNRLENGPYSLFAWKTPKTQIFSDAGSFVAFPKVRDEAVNRVMTTGN